VNGVIKRVTKNNDCIISYYLLYLLLWCKFNHKGVVVVVVISNENRRSSPTRPQLMFCTPLYLQIYFIVIILILMLKWCAGGFLFRHNIWLNADNREYHPTYSTSSYILLNVPKYDVIPVYCLSVIFYYYNLSLLTYCL